MNVAEVMVALADMTVSELRQQYAEVFGETTNSRHKGFLRKRIAWRMQAQAEGGLSERACTQAEKLTDEAGLRLSPPKRMIESVNGQPRRKDPRLPMPGVVLTRKYKNQEIHVTVLEHGFEYEGKIYRSLSAVARRVTGSHWNGYDFFNLRRKKGNGNGRKKK